jgi:hypothetical protein
MTSTEGAKAFLSNRIKRTASNRPAAYRGSLASPCGIAAPAILHDGQQVLPFERRLPRCKLGAWGDAIPEWNFSLR